MPVPGLVIRTERGVSRAPSDPTAFTCRPLLTCRQEILSVTAGIPIKWSSKRHRAAAAAVTDNIPFWPVDSHAAVFAELWRWGRWHVQRSREPSAARQTGVEAFHRAV